MSDCIRVFQCEEKLSEHLCEGCVIRWRACRTGSSAGGIIYTSLRACTVIGRAHVDVAMPDDVHMPQKAFGTFCEWSDCS